MNEQKDPLSADIEKRIKKEQHVDRHEKKPHRADPQFWMMVVIALITVIGVVASIISIVK